MIFCFVSGSSRAGCIFPDNPNNGGFDYPQDNFNSAGLFLPGSILLYYCNVGYQLNGNQKVTCNINHWSPKPKCEGIILCLV